MLTKNRPEDYHFVIRRRNVARLNGPSCCPGRSTDARAWFRSTVHPLRLHALGALTTEREIRIVAALMVKEREKRFRASQFSAARWKTWRRRRLPPA
ncbi:hypothetical protein PCAR4_570273 [Paraburkholderia caribensis]|nr:hypothetical protein PCAR4_570273 [Paraburkholderia caribensis]